MRRKESVILQVVYCDVCKQKCGGNQVWITTKDGREYHACGDWNESLGNTCGNILELAQKEGRLEQFGNGQEVEPKGN
jgi:hypothetical protein